MFYGEILRGECMSLYYAQYTVSVHFYVGNNIYTNVNFFSLGIQFSFLDQLVCWQ